MQNLYPIQETPCVVLFLSLNLQHGTIRDLYVLQVVGGAECAINFIKNVNNLSVCAILVDEKERAAGYNPEKENYENGFHNYHRP